MKKKQLWGEHLEVPAGELNVLFCAGRDVTSLPPADQELIPYDVFTNLAHAKMLVEIGALETQEYRALQAALIEIYELNEKGNFPLDPLREDVHSNIELYLSEVKQIPAGKKIHSGRSRNDQVATDLRMWIRDQISEYALSCLKLCETIRIKAEEFREVPMPGFTHYQPAMWCTFAFWLSSWSEAILRSVREMKSWVEEWNFCPLGAAAGFGTAWSPNRELTADLLGFEGPTDHCLDGVFARTELDAQTAGVLTRFLHQASNIAQDLILLSHPYFGMLRLNDAFLTGSSIMPQKKNPDFAEVIRGKAAFALGIFVQLQGLQKGAFTGYNRDVQIGKPVILDLFREAKSVPEILSEVLHTMVVRTDVMQEKCMKGFMNSSDIADWLCKEKGLSFRDAYNCLARSVKYAGDAGTVSFEALNRAIREMELQVEIRKEELQELSDPVQCIQTRDHTGSPSPKHVSSILEKQACKKNKLEKFFMENKQKIEKVFKQLLEK